MEIVSGFYADRNNFSIPRIYFPTNIPKTRSLPNELYNLYNQV